MKSLSEVNRVLQTYIKLPSGINFTYDSETLGPAGNLRPDDDTAYFVGLYFEREGQRFNQGVIVYPWETEEKILEKFNETIIDLVRRMRTV